MQNELYLYQAGNRQVPDFPRSATIYKLDLLRDECPDQRVLKHNDTLNSPVVNYDNLFHMLTEIIGLFGLFIVSGRMVHRKKCRCVQRKHDSRMFLMPSGGN